MRDDPLPLATLAAELMAKAAREVQPDEDLRALLRDLEAVLPILRTDESRLSAARRPLSREEREAVGSAR